jgi:murein L,D-transpeptidase YafK
MYFRKLLPVLALITVSFSGAAMAAQEAPAAAQTADPQAVTPAPGQVPENIIFLSTDALTARHVFLADKSKRTLTVWSLKPKGAELLGAYPMDIGKRDGDKMEAGDHRTPEGIYFFQERMDGPGLNFDEYGKRAFTLDYPNFFDRLIGKTGSGIWLHAVPETKSLFRGSRGCVVVRNEIIDKLTDMISLKSTPMVIMDKVNYISSADASKRRTTAQAWLESWRQSWESKNIAQYMTHYADEFKAMKMGKNQWQRYKEELNKKYDYIRVKTNDAILVERKEEAILHFVQDYESKKIKDIGQKSLYLRRGTASQYEILTEIWQPLSTDLLAHKQSAASRSN